MALSNMMVKIKIEIMDIIVGSQYAECNLDIMPCDG